MLTACLLLNTTTSNCKKVSGVVTMLFRQLFTPSKRHLLGFAFIAAIFVALSIGDAYTSRLEELKTTNIQLQKYSDQLQKLKSDHTILQHKLNDTEQQLAASGPGTSSAWINGLPVIYLITPTYTRLEQKAELTRLSHTLMMVRNIHWIIVEDSDTKTTLVSRFLNKTGLNYTHLNVSTPPKFKPKPGNPKWTQHRGVSQRNAGLEWLRSNTSPQKQPGVFYFADDDNTYSLKLFDEMRYTKRVSVWPVGLVGDVRYEGPIVENNKVTGWRAYWERNRPFPIDMAGFAINLQLLHDHPDAAFTNSVNIGYLESTILTTLGISKDDLEPKANMCSEVLVWHTRTEKSKIRYEEKMIKEVGTGVYQQIEV